MKGKFFYNFNATQTAGYNKFAFGVMDIECDNEKDLTDEAFSEIKKFANESYPDADNINFVAFNRV